MQKPNDRPLVTFAVLAYNQEQYVRQAVSGALLQTYRPLRIVLSDDCSSDRTFDVMREMTADYTGPAEIVLNRNSSNIGIGAHFNKLIELSVGELLVCAAGDDISIADRTALLVDAWMTAGKPAAICSDVDEIDESGRSLPDSQWFHEKARMTGDRMRDAISMVNSSSPAIVGCSAAYRLGLFDTFGGLPNDVQNEDGVLTLRVLLAGSTPHFVPTKLVSYRRHIGSLTGSAKDKSTSIEQLSRLETKNRRLAESFVALCQCYESDIDVSIKKGLATAEEVKDLRKVVKSNQRLGESKRDWWNLPFSNRIRKIAAAALDKDRATLSWMMPRILGYNLFIRGKQIKRLVFR
jgi:glycosyltransferase involved in cell wall biosynthesis